MSFLFFFFNYSIIRYYRAEVLTSRLQTGTTCQISVGFRLEVKCTLFTVARTWKQPRCPWADEWIRKLSYIYMMEYYSAIKRNALESVLIRWMNLEPIIQNDVKSERERQILYINAYIWNLE